MRKRKKWNKFILLKDFPLFCCSAPSCVCLFLCFCSPPWPASRSIPCDAHFLCIFSRKDMMKVPFVWMDRHLGTCSVLVVAKERGNGFCTFNQEVGATRPMRVSFEAELAWALPSFSLQISPSKVFSLRTKLPILPFTPGTRSFFFTAMEVPLQGMWAHHWMWKALWFTFVGGELCWKSWIH